MFSRIDTLTYETFSSIPNYSKLGKWMAYGLFIGSLLSTYQAMGLFWNSPKSSNLLVEKIEEFNQEAYFTNVNPTDQAIEVSPEQLQITVGLVTPDGFELDETTLDGNVQLLELVNGQEVEVPANINDTGGGDVIILTPQNPLKEFSNYIFRINPGVEANKIGDVSFRVAFTPFTSSFTTGQGTASLPKNLENVSFTQVKELGLERSSVLQV